MPDGEGIVAVIDSIAVNDAGFKIAVGVAHLGAARLLGRLTRRRLAAGAAAAAADVQKVADVRAARRGDRFLRRNVAGIVRRGNGILRLILRRCGLFGLLRLFRLLRLRLARFGGGFLRFRRRFGLLVVICIVEPLQTVGVVQKLGIRQQHPRGRLLLLPLRLALLQIQKGKAQCKA